MRGDAARAAGRAIEWPAAALLLALVVAYFAPSLFGRRVECAWDERAFEPWRGEAARAGGAAPERGSERGGRGPVDAALLSRGPGLTADGVLSYYPRRVALHGALREGRLPLWSRESFCGAPFLANFQSGVLYPPNWLIAPFSPERGMGIFAALHVLVLGLGALALLRELGATRVAAAAGAVAASWNGFVVVRLAHPTAVATLAWLPWLLLLARRLVRAPSGRGAAAVAIAWALAILAGFPPVLVYVGYAVALFSIFVATEREAPCAGSAATALGAIAAVAAALLVGTALAAPQLLATLELSRFSDRATIPFPSILSSAIHPVLAVRLVAPRFFGDPITGGDLSRAFTRGDGHYSQTFLSSGCYIGIVVLLLAAVGASDRRREARCLALLAALGTLLAFGSPLLRLVAGALPGFRIARIDRAIAMTHFAAALLAGLGLDRLARDPVARRRLLVASVACAAALGALVGLGLGGRDLAAAFLPESSARSAAPDAAASSLARPLLGAAALAGLLAASLAARSAPRALWLALPLVAIDLGSFAVRHHVTRDERDFAVETQGIAWLRTRTAAARAGGAGAPRIVRVGTAEPALLPPNLPGLFDLEDVQGYNALAVGHYLAYVGAIDPEARRDRRVVALSSEGRALDSPLLALLAAPLVVSREPLPGRAPSYAGRDLVVTEVAALPRAFLVHHALVAADAADAIARIGSGAVDPRRTALVVRSGAVAGARAVDAFSGLASQPTAQAPGESIAWSAWTSPEEIALRVRAEAPAIVCLSEVWYPGWEASVDGVRVDLLQVNGIFRGVRVGAGEHDVWLRYRPRSLRVGFALAAAALVAAAVLAAKRPARSLG